MYNEGLTCTNTGQMKHEACKDSGEAVRSSCRAHKHAPVIATCICSWPAWHVHCRCPADRRLERGSRATPRATSPPVNAV